MKLVNTADFWVRLVGAVILGEWENARNGGAQPPQTPPVPTILENPGSGVGQAATRHITEQLSHLLGQANLCNATPHIAEQLSGLKPF